MEDINKLITQKASGANRLKPDEQKNFLETYQERVVAYSSIADAHSRELEKEMGSILTSLLEEYQPLFLKISPNIDEGKQVFYLKVAQTNGIVATIVSEECSGSPYGLILHTDHDLEIEAKNLVSMIPEAPSTSRKVEKKGSLWSRIFK